MPYFAIACNLVTTAVHWNSSSWLYQGHSLQCPVKLSLLRGKKLSLQGMGRGGLPCCERSTLQTAQLLTLLMGQESYCSAQGKPTWIHILSMSTQVVTQKAISDESPQQGKPVCCCAVKKSRFFWAMLAHNRALFAWLIHTRLAFQQQAANKWFCHFSHNILVVW